MIEVPLEAETPETKETTNIAGDNIDLRTEVNRYPWPADIAYAVAFAESGLNTSAINLKDRHKGCNGSYGAFQLSCLHGTTEELLDGKKNVEIAYNLWQKEGWSPWSV